MGCKETSACENQREQNFQGNRPSNYQCQTGENARFVS